MRSLKLGVALITILQTTLSNPANSLNETKSLTTAATTKSTEGREKVSVTETTKMFTSTVTAATETLTQTTEAAAKTTENVVSTTAMPTEDTPVGIKLFKEKTTANKTEPKIMEITTKITDSNGESEEDEVFGPRIDGIEAKLEPARHGIPTKLEEKLEALSCDVPPLPSESTLWNGNETRELSLPITVSSPTCSHGPSEGGKRWGGRASRLPSAAGTASGRTLRAIYTWRRA